jgi:hypothetical protein
LYIYTKFYKHTDTGKQMSVYIHTWMNLSIYLYIELYTYKFISTCICVQLFIYAYKTNGKKTYFLYLWFLNYNLFYLASLNMGILGLLASRQSYIFLTNYTNIFIHPEKCNCREKLFSIPHMFKLLNFVLASRDLLSST